MTPEEFDAEDTLADKRALFDIPDDVIYLDGNSLGMAPRAIAPRLDQVLRVEWGNSLIRGWNEHDWIGLPQRVGNKIAPLIGASTGSVIAADSTSLNLLKVLSAAIKMRPERKVILSDTGNFPTDLYVAQGMLSALDDVCELKLVAPQDVEDAIDERVAIVMLTEVDYRTGRRHQMKELTECAHRAGALMIWDLAHSAGAFPVYLEDVQADFAVGCGYKYLNGGPGAPAFVYVRPDHAEGISPAQAGWMGHAAPFDFDLEYQPASGIDRMLVGTPSVLALSSLDTALDVWEGVSLDVIRKKSVQLTELFIREVEARCSVFGIKLNTPRNSEDRGSQVSFTCPNGYAVMQALIGQGVIGDFRAPDIIRFGFAPLYNSHREVALAARELERVLKEELWRAPEYNTRAKVT